MYHNLSKIFTMLHPDFKEEPEDVPVQVAAVKLLYRKNIDFSENPSIINVAASFYIWMQSRKRIIWRVSEESAAYVRGINISFIPEQPPPAWNGNSIIMESTKNPLFDDIMGITAYRCKDMKGKDRYFFLAAKYPDGVIVFSIGTDLSKINQKMAETEALLEPGYYDEDGLEGDWPAEGHQIAFDIIRFVFAFSYYVNMPDRVSVKQSGGPVERNPKGKPVKRKGKTVPLWSYSDIRIKPRESKDPINPRGQLDKKHLSLEPVIVSPSIRRYGEKVVFVDAYDSSRWKKTGVVGEKKKV